MRSTCVPDLYIEDDSGLSQYDTGQGTPCRGVDSSNMLNRRAWSRSFEKMENQVLVLHISGRRERQSQLQLEDR
jgi:hypothetical protein